MLGHTDTKTINQRRPLTTTMILVLADLMRDGPTHEREMEQADKNALRGLIARGYATWGIEGRVYSITQAGEEALKKGKP